MLFPVYKLISKTEYQEVCLILFELFFCAAEPTTTELVVPNMLIPLSTLPDCMISQKTIFMQMHSARLGVSGFTNELWPQKFVTTRPVTCIFLHFFVPV
jgi:hypothetical protein